MKNKEEKQETVAEEVTEATEEKVSAEEITYEELLAKAEAMEKELKEAQEEAARARADYYNLRNRVERDREKEKSFAAERSISLLLPVFENLERTCSAVEDKESNLFKGISMVTKQFFEAMTNLGLEEIEADGKFDPANHEAVMMEETDDEASDGKITAVFRKGYKLGGRVIRAAQVKVSNYTK